MAELTPWERRKEEAKLAIQRYEETGKAGCAIPAGIAVGALVALVGEQLIELLRDEQEFKYTKISLTIFAVSASVLLRQVVMHVLAKHHMESLMKSHSVVFEQALSELSPSIAAGTRESVLETLRKKKSSNGNPKWK